ncbi:methyltransferase-like protein 2A [Rhinatrema bivittatum]|uniref:methyltransferase-like protein 2A n=1 Tax=Rhinatrema bivittatum TaxID=194408 RepID=UPI00112E7CDD|nr:methyltransferase-like protein 2A [Rhinatrema bivittatum]
MAASCGDSSGKRPQFGSRLLTDPGCVFQHNAWDNVEWSEEQEALAQQKIKENGEKLIPLEKQAEYETKASKYWNDFYMIHENGFFKDRHWLFTEFPELAPNWHQRQSENVVPPAASLQDNSNGDARDSKHQPCAADQELDTEQSSHHKLHLGGSDLHCEPVRKLGDMKIHNCDFPGSLASFRVLEVGCGVGNTVFPVLQTNNDPALFVYCCDFSSTAVELLKGHAAYDPSRCFAFVHDVSEEQCNYPVPEQSLDIIILIFVLSSLLPDKMQSAINRMSHLLKPGGLILLRDYGRYDMAQLRFKKGRCLSDNFYVRGDGTRVYFFTQDELDRLFTAAGLQKVQNLVDRRLQVNRGKQLTMYRVWIQCKYRRPFLSGQEMNGHVH